MTKSIQHQAAFDAYLKHHRMIESSMIQMAEFFITRNMVNRSCHLVDDGMFEPWQAYSKEYVDCIDELGNADDEVMFISQMWQIILNAANPVRYAYLISIIKDIDENGL